MDQFQEKLGMLKYFISWHPNTMHCTGNIGTVMYDQDLYFIFLYNLYLGLCLGCYSHLLNKVKHFVIYSFESFAEKYYWWIIWIYLKIINMFFVTNRGGKLNILVLNILMMNHCWIKSEETNKWKKNTRQNI